MQNNDSTENQLLIKKIDRMINMENNNLIKIYNNIGDENDDLKEIKQELLVKIESSKIIASKLRNLVLYLEKNLNDDDLMERKRRKIEFEQKKLIKKLKKINKKIKKEREKMKI